ncbi:hypothetical protein ACLB2K_046023 [Fragaria x ananassa]
MYTEYEADVRILLKVRTSVRSPPSDADDGAPPPHKTPVASPTTFPPRRVNSFPVFRRDHPKLQTKSISPEIGKKQTRRGGEVVGDAAGVFWGGGAPSPAPEGGERTDVRTLSREGYETDVHTWLKVRTSIRSPPSGSGDGAPPPQKTPAASPTTSPPRRVRFFLVFRPDRLCLKFWVISPKNWKRTDSPGRKSDRGHCWSLLRWRRAVAVAGAGGRRTGGRPHFKPSADVRFISFMYIYIYSRDPERTSAQPLKCGRPSVLHHTAPTTARLYPSGLQ